MRDAAPNLTACRPHTPAEGRGFADDQFPHLRPLVADLLRDRAPDGYDVWFYTPMAFPLARDLTPRAVAYDCMDELSAFKFAPPELLERAQQLSDRADVVFTGGPSLYQAKKHRHTNCHCFSSSVDAAHFGGAAGPVAEPKSQAGIPHPRLGFFGVIDERFDRDLLAAAADARPEWQFVMVGPVVKLAPEELPRRANIHYLGQQQCAELPAFLAG